METPPSKDPVVKQDTDFYVLGRALAAPVTDNLLDEKARCPFQVIISLTTSPKRIAKVPKILQLLDSRSYDAIELNLPQQYGKDKLTYKITKDIETFPKVTLFWF
jgi:hypothetical protein